MIIYLSALPLPFSFLNEKIKTKVLEENYQFNFHFSRSFFRLLPDPLRQSKEYVYWNKLIIK